MTLAGFIAATVSQNRFRASPGGTPWLGLRELPDLVVFSGRSGKYPHRHPRVLYYRPCLAGGRQSLDAPRLCFTP